VLNLKKIIIYVKHIKKYIDNEKQTEKSVIMNKYKYIIGHKSMPIKLLYFKLEMRGKA